MAYVPPKYPAAIPTAGDLPDRADDVDWMYAARYNELKKELRAALIELGTLPKGASADVKTRLGLLALKASPVFTGDATIPTINLTGGQIKFPAAAAASADPNTLDDYEEGSWTPDLQFGGAKVGIAYTMQAGRYTKIGNIVTLTGRISLSNKGSSVGGAKLEGLPFTVFNANGCDASVAVYLEHLGFADFFEAWARKNQSSITLVEITNAGDASVIADTDFENNSEITICVTYKAV